MPYYMHTTHREMKWWSKSLICILDSYILTNMQHMHYNMPQKQKKVARCLI